MSGLPSFDVRRSATLSSVLAVIGLVLAVVCAIGLIPLIRRLGGGQASADGGFVVRVGVPIYVCLVGAIAVLVVMLQLLGDIRRGDIITSQNVRRMRFIRYCGIAIFLGCVLGGFLVPSARIVFFAIAGVTAAYLGYLMFTMKKIVVAAPDPQTTAARRR